MENFETQLHEEKTSKKAIKINKKESFTSVTNKILEKEGVNPKDFDKEAIKNARQKVYDKFVKENIGKLLD